MHDQGRGQADVTEGPRGVWERLDYDWSDPHRVIMTITDSNVWGGGSGQTYTLTRQPDGTTGVDAVVVREGKNFKGRVLAIVLGTIGKRALGKEPGKTVKAIETRNDSGAASRTACGGLLSRTGAGGLIHYAPYRASVHTEGSES